MPKPLILTMGDPTGIGPEIIVKATAVGGFNSIDRPLIVAGDPGFLLAAADVCGLPDSLTQRVGEPWRSTFDGPAMRACKTGRPAW